MAALAGLAAFLVHISFHFPTAAGTSLALTFAAILCVMGEARRAPEPAPARMPTGAWIATVAVASALSYGLILVPLRADVFAQAGTVVLRTDPQRAAACRVRRCGSIPRATFSGCGWLPLFRPKGSPSTRRRRGEPSSKRRARSRNRA